MSSTASGNKVDRFHCNQCHETRDHDVLHHAYERWSDAADDDNTYEIAGGDTYFTVRCRGCRNVHFRHESWFSEETEADGSPIIGLPPEKWPSLK